jgi:hypothetical protein
MAFTAPPAFSMSQSLVSSVGVMRLIHTAERKRQKFHVPKYHNEAAPSRANVVGDISVQY